MLKTNLNKSQLKIIGGEILLAAVRIIKSDNIILP